jgi:biopolymer transport protein ExbB/TolQ
VQFLIAASLAHNIEQAVYEAAKILFYPILVLTLGCLVWVLIELGFFIYEAYLRMRYRDLEALEIRTLKARDAFDNDQPRRAYRYLQENNYSVVVARFLFELIRNYQTQRVPEKPLKLLQEYEFYTVKRLERTRILVRLGPILGLMGTLIPLAPALQALANGDTQKLADNLTVAFSVTVLGLLIGGLAFMISIVRDRFYSQDISDLEYLLELLEGGAPPLRIGRARRRKGEFETFDGDLSDEDEAADEPTVVVAPPAAAGAAVEGTVPVTTPGDASAVPTAAPGGASLVPPALFARPLPVVPGFEPEPEVAPQQVPEIGHGATESAPDQASPLPDAQTASDTGVLPTTDTPVVDPDEPPERSPEGPAPRDWADDLQP